MRVTFVVPIAANSAAEKLDVTTIWSTSRLSRRLMVRAAVPSGSHRGTRERRMASMRSCEKSTSGMPRRRAQGASQPTLSLSLTSSRSGPTASRTACTRDRLVNRR
jgi:hypothetical protein